MTKQTRKFDLDKARIATPCPANWNDMKGDDRQRHCGACKLNVYNVAGLTKAEAEALLERRVSGERVCVRLMRRQDGTIITKDCSVGISLARRAKLKAASMYASAFALCIGLFSVRTVAQEETSAPVALMGKIAAPRDFQEDQMIMGGLRAPIDENGEVEMMGEVAPEEPYERPIENPEDIEPGTSPEDYND